MLVLILEVGRCILFAYSSGEGCSRLRSEPRPEWKRPGRRQRRKSWSAWLLMLIIRLTILYIPGTDEVKKSINRKKRVIIDEQSKRLHLLQDYGCKETKR